MNGDRLMTGVDRREAVVMICRFCGVEGTGEAFNLWVKPTFTDWDKLLPGDIICDDCAFWFDEASEVLTARTGKDKLQRMRNYSHFVLNGEWTPLSKGDKAQMQAFLCADVFPELAVIAESGQKHIVFRATRNPVGSSAGWVQFEEHSLWVDPPQLRALIERVEELYVTFSKTEIETGNYQSHRILKFGVRRWMEADGAIKPLRGSPLLALALFLAQRSEDDAGGTTESGGGAAAANVAGAGQRPEIEVPDEHLDAVRGSDTQRSVHEQSGEIRQLSLF
jgi:hypothetical protein